MSFAVKGWTLDKNITGLVNVALSKPPVTQLFLSNRSGPTCPHTHKVTTQTHSLNSYTEKKTEGRGQGFPPKETPDQSDFVGYSVDISVLVKAACLTFPFLSKVKTNIQSMQG